MLGQNVKYKIGLVDLSENMLGRPVGKYAYSRPLDKICLVRM